MFAMSVFVTSTIEEFYCGALILREINGANEGLLTMQGFYFFAALFGTDVWLTPIPIASWLTMPLGRCILLSVVLIAVPTIFASYFAVYKHGHAKNDNRLLQKVCSRKPPPKVFVSTFSRLGSFAFVPAFVHVSMLFLVLPCNDSIPLDVHVYVRLGDAIQRHGEIPPPVLMDV